MPLVEQREAFLHADAVIDVVSNKCPDALVAKEQATIFTPSISMRLESAIGRTCTHDVNVLLEGHTDLIVRAGAVLEPIGARLASGGALVIHTPTPEMCARALEYSLGITYSDPDVIDEAVPALVVFVVTMIALLGIRIPGTTTRYRIEPRLGLCLGGCGLSMWLGVERHAFGGVVSWGSSFTPLLLAFGFAAIVKRKNVTSGIVNALAHARIARTPLIAIYFATAAVFLINTVITSAATTCALVAPVALPFLQRAGLGVRAAVGALMIGTFGGFLNPADTGGAAISDVLTANDLPPAAFWLHIPIGLVCMCVAVHGYEKVLRWKHPALLNVVPPVSSDSDGLAKQPQTSSSGWLRRGSVVLLPLALFLVITAVSYCAGRDISSSAALSISMGFSILVAIAMCSDDRAPLSLRGDVMAVAEGMWKGFLDVVLLLVAARIFAAPYAVVLDAVPREAAIVLVVLAFALPVAIGSGDGIIASLVGVVAPIVSSHRAGMVGSMMWLGTELGRCASPISSGLRAILSSEEIRETSPELHGRAIFRLTVFPMFLAFLIGIGLLWLTAPLQ